MFSSDLIKIYSFLGHLAFCLKTQDLHHQIRLKAYFEAQEGHYTKIKELLYCDFSINFYSIYVSKLYTKYLLRSVLIPQDVSLMMLMNHKVTLRRLALHGIDYLIQNQFRKLKWTTKIRSSSKKSEAAVEFSCGMLKHKLSS